MGWVCGGAVAVVKALEEALGPEGTLVVPTHSSDLSEPSLWKNPPVPESWWPTIRETMPAYEARMTPTRGVGAIPECFRNQAGTLRSPHPSDSFAARGPHARAIVGRHAIDHPFGGDSPLARVYDLDGWVLMLGTGYQCATSLHLAEFRARYPRKKRVSRGAPMMVRGRRKWVEYEEIDWDDSDFEAIGNEFAKTKHVRSGRVGNAASTLVPQRQLVDFAVKWIEKNRKG
jgi:aminoglycoside 3-N-acetyltransferase